MGAVYGKDSKEKTKASMPPPASVHAIRSLLYGSTDAEGEQFRSLDRTLKGFLKASNMSGLEYRLRLAGIYTLEDLVVSDEAFLSRHGFTLLMARRLFRALEEYLLKPDRFDDMGAKNRPLSVTSTSKGSDKLEDQTHASTLLLSRDSYGKRNRRRKDTAPYSLRTLPKKEPTPPTPTNGNKLEVPGSITNVPPSARKVISSFPKDIGKQTSLEVIAEVHLKEEEDRVGSSSLVSEVINEQRKTESEIPPQPSPNEEAPPSSSLTPPNSSPVPNKEKFATLSKTLLQDESPVAIERHLSVPIGLNCIHSDTSSLWHVAQYSGRSLSCPILALTDDVSLSPEARTDELEEILFALQSREPRDVEELLGLLYSLLELVKSSDIGNILDALKNVSDVLFNHLNNIMVAEVSCRILKYLSSDLGHVQSLEPDVLHKVMQVVLEVIRVHTFSKRCQLNGCLVINNIYRSGYPASVKTEDVLSVLNSSLENYRNDETTTLAIMSGMVAALASETVTSSTVSQQMQSCLKQICSVLDAFMNNIPLSQYALSFFTLALIEVAPQMDDMLMKSMIRLVTLSLKTHKERSDVVVWGCKAVSQMSAHKLIEEESTGKELTNCLSEVLSLHPTSSSVQLWGSYALYQLASYNSSLISHVKDSGCLERRKHSLPHLNEEARSYVEQLARLATL